MHKVKLFHQFWPISQNTKKQVNRKTTAKLRSQKALLLECLLKARCTWSPSGNMRKLRRGGRLEMESALDCTFLILYCIYVSFIHTRPCASDIQGPKIGQRTKTTLKALGFIILVIINSNFCMYNPWPSFTLFPSDLLILIGSTSENLLNKLILFPGARFITG